jgi:CheY-like chemotaxis protein
MSGQQPVILLIDSDERENCILRQWLEETDVSTHETADVFEAIEEINDFTMRRCPDLILLEVESDAQDSVKELFLVSSGEGEIPIFSFCSKSAAGQNRANSQAAILSQLKARFNKVPPGLSRAA